VLQLRAISVVDYYFSAIAREAQSGNQRAGDAASAEE
jgi:hypothetical protein